MPLNFTIMNKLQFHEGGQPIQLDDLQLLQDNSFDLFRVIMDFISGETPAFLLRFPKITTKRKEDGGHTSTVQAGKLIVNGEVLGWEETIIDGNTARQPIYACVHQEESDIRTFADGQSRKCRVSKRISIGMTKEGVEEAYDITTLPLLSDLVKDLVNKGEWIYSPVVGSNGYDGYFRFRNVNGNFYIQIELSSSNREWAADGENKEYKAAFSVRTISYIRLAGRTFVIKNGTQEVGTLLFSDNSFAIIKPIDNSLAPYNCPIKLDIKI